MSRSHDVTARIAAYGAAALATLYAAVSLYWTLGGTALLSTVGGAVADLALRRSPAAVAVGALTVALKLAGAVIALALVAPPRPGLFERATAVLAFISSTVLTLYGLVLVVAGAFVLSGVIKPGGLVDRHALRWHVFLWDLWFLLWGLSLGLAVVLRRRR